MTINCTKIKIDLNYITVGYVLKLYFVKKRQGVIF
jgi:hypothetical protein